MKRAKLILLALALPFVMVPTVRANDGHEGDKDKHEHHDNDRHDKEGHDQEGHDRDNHDSDKHDNDGKTTHTAGRVPINAGIGILLVAGLGLGAKVMIDRNKKKATVI